MGVARIIGEAYRPGVYAIFVHEPTPVTSKDWYMRRSNLSTKKQGERRAHFVATIKDFFHTVLGPLGFDPGYGYGIDVGEHIYFVQRLSCQVGKLSYEYRATAQTINGVLDCLKLIAQNIKLKKGIMAHHDYRVCDCCICKTAAEMAQQALKLDGAAMAKDPLAQKMLQEAEERQRQFVREFIGLYQPEPTTPGFFIVGVSGNTKLPYKRYASEDEAKEAASSLVNDGCTEAFVLKAVHRIGITKSVNIEKLS